MIEVAYIPNPAPPEPNQIGSVVFGMYRVRFPDGITVAVPHTGYPGTVSQAPLDVREDRDHILSLARMAHPA